MLYYITAAVGLLLTYESIIRIANNAKREEIYEDARKERLRKLGQRGDLSQSNE